MSDPNEPVIHTASISRIGTAAKCSAMLHLRYDCGVRPESEASYFFVGKTFHASMEAYYECRYHLPTAALSDLLEKKLLAHGLTEKQIDAAYSVGKIEAEILEKFSSGKITKKDGSLYTAPKMTTAYKDLARAENLFGKIKSLEGVKMQAYQDELGFDVPSVNLKEDGIHGLVGRLNALTKRYEETLMIPRECFEEIHIESEFKFDEPMRNGELFRWKGFMDLFGRLKPEFREKYANGKSWVLIDYKTGKAKDKELHAAAADESLQLTLYYTALIRQFGIPQDDLFVALHYVDAAYCAATERDPEDFNTLMPLAEAYVAGKGAPIICKRLTYSDNQDCGYCDIREACEKKFGFATRTAAARAAVKEAMPILDALAEG